MSIICSKFQSTRNLNWHKDTRCFVAEASDLGMGAHDGRVYDDACDVGFVLISHITGDAILFVQNGVDMNGDDVAGWRYKAEKYSGSTAGQWISVPAHLKDLTALVIND